MTKRQAKRWACGLAAATLAADSDQGIFDRDDESEADQERKRQAWQDLVNELRRRGDFAEFPR